MKYSKLERRLAKQLAEISYDSGHYCQIKLCRCTSGMMGSPKCLNKIMLHFLKETDGGKK